MLRPPRHSSSIACFRSKKHSGTGRGRKDSVRAAALPHRPRFPVQRAEDAARGRRAAPGARRTPAPNMNPRPAMREGGRGRDVPEYRVQRHSIAGLTRSLAGGRFGGLAALQDLLFLAGHGHECGRDRPRRGISGEATPPPNPRRVSPVNEKYCSAEGKNADCVSPVICVVVDSESVPEAQRGVGTGARRFAFPRFCLSGG